VVIAGVVLDIVVRHARAEAPAECCGLLIGSAGHIVDAVRSSNLSADPHRYLIDPEAHFSARRAARARGLSVVGFYHSHPHSAAAPSATDAAEATYPDHLYLIVGLGGGEADARLFRFDQRNFVPIEFVTES
jgi:proteasome lid subunit RPN8/RPN11